MRTIWKFELEPDTTRVRIPEEHKFMSVQTQNGRPCVWAFVESASNMIERSIKCYGTGHKVTHTEGQYIGTFQLEGGALVFHAFALDE